MSSRAALAAAVLAALISTGCGGTDVGFGVALTLRFDSSVSASSRASIGTLEFVASGDETYDKTVALDHPPASVERTVYRPDQATRQLSISVFARDGQGVELARGSTGALSLSAGHSTSATVELAAPAAGDGGSPDEGLSDGGGLDAFLPDGGPPEVPSFVSTASFPTATGPTTVVVGDVNGDKLPDIVVAATDGSKIQVFTATAAARYPALPTFETAVTRPSAIAIADLDQNGKKDLLVTDSSTGVLRWFMGNGDGTFKPSTTIATLAGADAVVVSNFDADSANDVAIASSTQSGIVIYYGNDGSHQTIPTTNPMTKMYGVDMNADGALDFLGIEGGNRIVTIINTGKRTFSAENLVGTTTQADVAALSKAGVAPQVIAVSPGGTGSLWANDGTGKLSPSTSNTGLPALSSISHVAVADLDGDGKLDLVESAAAGTSSYYQTLLYAFGSQGPLSGVTTTQPFATEDDPRGFAVADVNGDGALDVVLANHGSSTVAIYYTSGNAKVYAAPRVFGDALVGDFDFNGDGKLDAELSDGTSLLLSPGDGTGAFGASLVVASSGPVLAASAGDLDGDGKRDVVWITSGGALERALAATGGFGTPQSITTGGSFVDLALGDITGDGKLDVVVLDASATANSSSANVVVYPGDGAGNFGAAVRFAAGSPVRMKLGDVNGDGKLDVVVATSAGHIVTLIQQTGTLSAAIDSPTLPSTLVNLALVDADGDGKLDVVVGGTGTQLLLNDGTGKFTDAGLLAADTIDDLAVASVNRDDHPDLCVLVDSRLVLLVGDGKTFQLASAYTSGANGVRLFMGDFTSDGADDALAFGQTTALLVNATK